MQCYFFIYSITERSSFDEIKNFYYKEAIAHCEPHPSNNILLTFSSLSYWK